MTTLDTHQREFARAILAHKEAPAIDFVELYVSDVCALRCAHCFHGETRSASAPLTIAEWIQAIEAFIQLGARKFHLTGREPFASASTLPLLQYLKTRKDAIPLRIGAICDGFTWTKFAGEISDDLLDYLEFSLDGSAVSNDLIRGAGSFGRITKGIATAIEVFHESKLSIAMTLLTTNYASVRDCILHAEQLGISRYYFQPMQVAGWGSRDQELTADAYAELIGRTRDLLQTFQGPHSAIFFVPCHLVHGLIRKAGWLKTLLDAQLLGKPAVVACGEGVLGLNFEVLRLSYWDHFILTHDGYLIPHFSDRSGTSYAQRAVGSVREKTIATLVEEGRRRAQREAEVLLNGIPA